MDGLSAQPDKPHRKQAKTIPLRFGKDKKKSKEDAAAKAVQELLDKPKRCIMGCGALVVGNYVCIACTGKKKV